jgi:hypothetical protein
MPGTQRLDNDNNDEELDAAMALAALVGGEASWRESRGSDEGAGGEELAEGRASEAEQGVSWSLRRRRSGTVIVVNEQGSQMKELSRKMQEWEERQKRGANLDDDANKAISSNERSVSGLSEATADQKESDVSKGPCWKGAASQNRDELKGPGESHPASLVAGVDQAVVEKAFQQGLMGIAQLLQDERPLIRAPSFPPQLSVNTLLPQLSLASQSSFGGLQSQLSLGLQSQRSNAGELQSQLSAPSAFLAAIAASLPPTASQPWPSFPTLANPLSNPVSNPIGRTQSGPDALASQPWPSFSAPFSNPASNPIGRTQSGPEYPFVDTHPAPQNASLFSGPELPSPKLVNFLPSADAEREKAPLERAGLQGLEVLPSIGEEGRGLGFGAGGGDSKRRLVRARRKKAAVSFVSFQWWSEMLRAGNAVGIATSGAW